MLKHNKAQSIFSLVEPQSENVTEALFENCIWMSTGETAEYLRTSSQQIRNWVYQGKLKAYKLGRKLLFKKTDLDSALKPTGG